MPAVTVFANIFAKINKCLLQISVKIFTKKREFTQNMRKLNTLQILPRKCSAWFTYWWQFFHFSSVFLSLFSHFRDRIREYFWHFRFHFSQWFSKNAGVSWNLWVIRNGNLLSTSKSTCYIKKKLRKRLYASKK